jgi:hypothetical protein
MMVPTRFREVHQDDEEPWVGYSEGGLMIMDANGRFWLKIANERSGYWVRAYLGANGGGGGCWGRKLGAEITVIARPLIRVGVATVTLVKPAEYNAPIRITWLEVESNVSNVS